MYSVYLEPFQHFQYSACGWLSTAFIFIGCLSFLLKSTCMYVLLIKYHLQRICIMSYHVVYNIGIHIFVCPTAFITLCQKLNKHVLALWTK
jgi:hypothetical protein